MDALESYISELGYIHSSGSATNETSYYGPLANLLNEVGKTLKPRVRCIINIKNRGAGIPDGGLFTPDQFQRAADAEPLQGLLPSRGAIEVKGTGENVEQIVESHQVARYLGKYGQVLVTNLRDFVLVGQDADGKPVKLETYRLAPTEAVFWFNTHDSHKVADLHSERFTEYLKRVMLRKAQLSDPKDVAWFLASYARDAKARIEHSKLPALDSVRRALEQALGLQFEGEKGDHFFRSTLVQTLFYGVFSAWVLWHNGSAERKDYFEWRLSAFYLRVPMMQVLFEEVAKATKLEQLNLLEVLDWTGAALNSVNRKAFFERFEQGHAVQYFYEPFLEAFDPELRKALGVWYTPPEIVRYMVARVDTVLREELGIKDGLADPRVYVLDPCCGTGAYLVEVLKRIAQTIEAKGGDALGSNDLKQAAMTRVFGFEILPAPFVVAHLQLGLLLQNLGAPLSVEGHERAGVYLTNALTGWEPPKGPKQHLLYPELEQERDAAEHVKRDAEILVVIGNPPYNAFAGTSPVEEQGLVKPYKEGLISKWGIKKFNLDDLYIRFFRLAERRIAEMTGKGVVCYISNFSYLSDPSYVVMRQRFLEGFDKLWFDCMNGDSRETGKLTPEGKPDPSVFSTEYNREGIRIGTAIGLVVRKEGRDPQPTVRFRQFWGVSKRADLAESLKVPDVNGEYETVNPDKSNRFSFRISGVATHYLAWPRLVDLSFQHPFAGLSEDRRKTLIGTDRSAIKARMLMYFNPGVTWEQLAALKTCLTTDVPRFDAKRARQILLQAETYNDDRLLQYAMRPFDTQWCYYSPIRPLWREPRPEYWASYEVGTASLVTRFKAAKSLEGPPITFARQLCDYHMMPPNASVFPFRLRPSPKSKVTTGQMGLFGEGDTPTANLSPIARAYLSNLGIGNPDSDAETAGLVWMHALAIGYSPAYLSENADGIRQDWPRIPLPESAEALSASAGLGKQVAVLLDTEAAVAGVTTGTIRPELRVIATIQRIGGGQLDPTAGDLALTAGWGHGGQNGVTMPGKGRNVRREYKAGERAAIEEGAVALALSDEAAWGRLGATTYDIYLNNIAYWQNVPARVWDYTIGGYQVIKKWLSYREKELLGRDMTPDEVREVMDMARRIAAILLLEPALDMNYRAVKETCYEWPSLA